MKEKPRVFNPEELFDYLRSQLGVKGRKLIVYPARLGKGKVLFASEPLDELLRLQREASGET